MNSELIAGDTTVFFLLLISNTKKFPTKLINPLVPNAPYFPLKTSEISCFQGAEKGCIWTK